MGKPSFSATCPDNLDAKLDRLDCFDCLDCFDAKLDRREDIPTAPTEGGRLRGFPADDASGGGSRERDDGLDNILATSQQRPRREVALVN